MDTKKKHNSRNTIDLISICILVAFAIANIFMYATFKNPTTQITAMFLAEILLTIAFMLLTLLDTIQLELHDIKDSLDELYDLKQINGLRSTVNKRHVEELLNDIEKTINDTYNGGKINEEN